MKRISLYGDMEDDDADYIEATFLPVRMRTT